MRIVLNILVASSILNATIKVYYYYVQHYVRWRKTILLHMWSICWTYDTNLGGTKLIITEFGGQNGLLKRCCAWIVFELIYWIEILFHPVKIFVHLFWLRSFSVRKFLKIYPFLFRSVAIIAIFARVDCTFNDFFSSIKVQTNIWGVEAFVYF